MHPTTHARRHRANRSSGFQVFHRDLARMVADWEELLAPDEVATLIEIGGRILERHRRRYRRWLDVEHSAA